MPATGRRDATAPREEVKDTRGVDASLGSRAPRIRAAARPPRQESTVSRSTPASTAIVAGPTPTPGGHGLEDLPRLRVKLVPGKHRATRLGSQIGAHRADKLDHLFRER